ncbi:MAG: SRPBCC domain-containing protein [Hyphomonadaceae bacterium]
MPASDLCAERDPDRLAVIYIAARPQKIRDPLTDRITARPWWARTHKDSSFEVGVPMIWRGNGKVDLRGEILERDLLHRPVYTSHVEGPSAVHDEGPSIVTYDISRSGDMAMLVVTHGGCPKNSLSHEGVEGGWPAILSSLKTVIETGQMPAFKDRGEQEFGAAQEKQVREHGTGAARSLST